MKTIFIFFSLLTQYVSLAQDSLKETPLPAKYKALEKYNTPKEYDFGNVKVTAICTGYISTDNKYPEPVFVWLVKTPSGNYLVDAGLSNRILEKDYFGGISRYYFHHEFTFYIYKSNNLVEQLKKLKITETELKAILLTHAHFDHIGYLPELKKVKVILTQKEKDEVTGSGQLAGYQKGTDKIIHLDRVEVAAIEKNEMKKLNDHVFLLRVDEHTKGHQVVIVTTEKGKLIFTGDLDLGTMEKESELYKFCDKTFDLKTCKLFFNHSTTL